MFRFKTERSVRTLARKMGGRAERSTRKLRSQDRIHNAGVYVSKTVVKNHRYLREHGLPHIPAVANVNIESAGSLTGRNLSSLALIALLMGLI